MSKQFVSIYEKDQVKIWGQIESHTSCITRNAYDEITHIKITKNDSLVYEAYGNALRYPFNHNNKDMIDFKKIVDDVVFLINYNNKNQVYSSYQNKVVDESICLLDELLYKKSCMSEIGIKRLKKQQQQYARQQAYNEVQNQNKELFSQVKTIAKKENLFIEYDGKELTIKTVDISNEQLYKYAKMSHKNTIEVADVILKQFNEFDYDKPEYNIYNQSSNNMLKDVIIYLRSYVKVVS